MDKKCESFTIGEPIEKDGQNRSGTICLRWKDISGTPAGCVYGCGAPDMHQFLMGKKHSV